MCSTECGVVTVLWLPDFHSLPGFFLVLLGYPLHFNGVLAASCAYLSIVRHTQSMHVTESNPSIGKACAGRKCPFSKTP
jgi:hypothetical protein